MSGVFLDARAQVCFVLTYDFANLDLLEPKE